ncbi:MAG: TonB-dependent receptor [Pusillimonas sp.]|uniref:TonB-dependent receptor n=1 Tax=Rhodanobacter sp. FW021-MT20 TaxID=1162282 RepID=UPI000260F8ED|nr:TonB-dependent receptor [Rhodanobacter sp. 115]EIL87435.1 TonB-dependent receptor-like protein [Rhodanobacter sp. 115]TAM00053.1 MAG: TonB-dependent receptor [Pusillimonas sp.]
MKTSTLRNAISIALLVVAAGTSGLALAEEAATDTTAPVRTSTTGPQVKTDFDLPAGKLATALDALGTQSGLQVNYPPALVAGRQGRAVHGRMSWRDALTQLLNGSGLDYAVVDSRTVAIRREAGQARAADSTAASPASGTTHPTPPVTNLESVQVTGTRIRGGTTPSPVITIGSEQIQQEGFTDLGQVIRSVPQNFGGGQNPGVIGAASGVGNQNLSGGSALNLRGLGADASLTLLNGHRLAYDGFSQAVDISAIPVEAIERLEIVPDGASAIYGSDAVGGVANVILKPDFDGVTLGARYGGATEGGLATREYTATAGTTWASGGLIATLKDTDADPIYARQRNYTRYLFEPYTIYSGSDSRSGLVSFHQSMGDVVELKLDALKTRRDVTSYAAVQAGSYYPSGSEGSITLVSPSIAFSLHHDWTLTLSGAYGKDDDIYASRFVSSAGNNLLSRTCYCNKSRSWEIGAEGPLFSVGGGDARLAIGAGTRKNEFLAVSYISGSRYGGDERARFAYAELNVPFVSPASGIPGVHRLEFSAAMRGEDYDSFGRVTTPKLGVIYDPSADFTLKASWGKSFKAPTLLQRYESKTAYLWSAPAAGANGAPPDATALESYGGNTDLHPERARTWSASLALHPKTLPGLDAELTWFNIDYSDRVVQPVVYQQALSNPAYADFVDWSPTLEKIQDLLAVYNSVFYNQSGVAYDPSKVVALISNQYVNAERQRIKGLDLSGSYRLDLGGNQLMVRGSASWLDSVQTTSSGQPEQTLAGTVFNPARLKGRVGAVWTSGGLSASGFVNYIGGVLNRFAPVTEKTASFTTLDTAISYNTGEHAGVFAGLTIGLSVQNLLNRAPPLYTAAVATYVPYDATNYSAIGRFVSVSVSKHW